ncbi:MAG: hypothetical protein QN229_06590 [Desulfurococcaceae archaeon TW002]
MILNKNKYFTVRPTHLLTILIVCYILVSLLLIESSSLTYNLVVFGSRSCPHCKTLHDFFSEKYQEKYYFFWVEDAAASNLFSKLAMIELNHGLSQNYALAVPQTLVLVDGTPVAIVVGVVTNTKFWNELMSSKVTGVVVVYLGETKSSIEIPNEVFTSLLSDLEKTLTQTTTQSSTTTQPNLIGLGLVVIGVAVLILYFVKRKTS